MVTALYDADANLDLLQGKTIAVIGYGRPDMLRPRT